jgi:hypothetical protein
MWCTSQLLLPVVHAAAALCDARRKLPIRSRRSLRLGRRGLSSVAGPPESRSKSKSETSLRCCCRCGGGGYCWCPAAAKTAAFRSDLVPARANVLFRASSRPPPNSFPGLADVRRLVRFLCRSCCRSLMHGCVIRHLVFWKSWDQIPLFTVFSSRASAWHGCSCWPGCMQHPSYRLKRV